MVCPALIIESSCNISKQKVEAGFPQEKHGLMHGSLVMFIGKRYESTQAFMLTWLLLFPSTVMSRLLCVKVTRCSKWNIAALLQNTQIVCFNSRNLCSPVWFSSPKHVYNIPKMHMSLHLKSTVREIKRDRRADFNLTIWHFLVLFSEITAWWGNRSKLCRKAGTEETRKIIL